MRRDFCTGQICMLFFFFQAEDGIRDLTVTGVQTCALPIYELPTDLKREVVDRVLRRPWGRYPEFVPAAVIHSLAKFTGWPSEGILVGNGSNELIQRSEEHTSELQSQSNLVCRLLLEKKKKLQP